MKKVLITGGNGAIGKIINQGLRGYEIVSVDLPEIDISDDSKVIEISKGIDTIIHLAWDTKRENWRSKKEDPENTRLFTNIYQAATKNGIPRIIMASSVHADDISSYWQKDADSLKNEEQSVLKIREKPKPNSAYGQHKVYMEKLGREVSINGPEVVCIRFGGIFLNRKLPYECAKVDGLTFPDCISLVERCLEAETIPEKFIIINGVSNNKTYPISFDTSNPLGWKPRHDAATFYEEK